MPRPTTHRLDDATRIAAALGAVLGALLAALLGATGMRRRATWAPVEPGVMTGVLRAIAEADMADEPYVEWVAVPAPWRAARLLPRPRRHTTPMRASTSAPSGALVHGPPA